MKIDSLNTFVVVAQRLNFSEAARQLKLPRATVSARIQELEKQLNTRLFLRNNRSVSLTPEGHIYLTKAEQALVLLDDAKQEIASTVISGPIRLGLPAAMIEERFLTQLIAFSDQYPEVSLELVISDSPADLAEQQIDIAIRGRKPVQADLIARTLPNERMTFVATKCWLSHQPKPINWSNVELHDPLDLADFEHAQSKIKTTDLLVSMALCQAGKGAAYLPYALVQEKLKAEQLIELESPDNAGLATLPMLLVYQHRDMLPRRVRLLIDHLLEYFRCSGQ